MSGIFDTSHLRGIFFREVDDDATTAAIEQALREGKAIETVETIYVERCRIKYAGDPKTETVFNAHENFQYFRAPNQRQGEWYTPAQFFPEQYELFAQGLNQVQDGIPIEECSGFISAPRILELKELDIHTAEALAGLEGSRLARLGPNGRALVQKAKAHIAASKSSGETAKLTAMVRDLQREIADLRGDVPPAKKAGKTPDVKPSAENGDDPPPNLKGAALAAWRKKQAAANLAKRKHASAEDDKAANSSDAARKMLEAMDEADLRNMLDAYGSTPKPGASKQELVEAMLEVNEKAARGLKATEAA